MRRARTRAGRKGISTDIYLAGSAYIRGVAVPKRLIDLDDDLLKEAQRELGTTGVSDTVRAALQQAAAAAARARQVQWLTSGGLGEMADPERRGQVWR